MAESDFIAGYQPSVLDRLIEGETTNAGNRRGYTETQILDAVRRDLEDLLNTRRPMYGELGIEGLTQVQTSVVGYGLPDFSNTRGMTDETRQAIAREVEAAIAAFEPRLADVQVTVHDPSKMQEKLKENFQQLAVYFHIEAKLRMEPSPPVAFETVLELAQGRHIVRQGET
ncbi:MAG: type VI secretion system baseplate subunit TssE [Gemmataceae bacterium]